VLNFQLSTCFGTLLYVGHGPASPDDDWQQRP